MTITYALDLTGVSRDNLVTEEIHTVSESQYRDYYFIVPNFSPFYVDNFKASISANNVKVDLKEDVDYSFTLEYIAGRRSTGKAMYGAVSLHNLNLNGVLYISYQTVGGDQVADRLEILTTLAEKMYNPRLTTWDLLSNVPNAFPPTPHYNDYEDFYGQEKVVDMLGQIRDAIVTNSSLTSKELKDFLELIKNGGLTDYVRRSGSSMQGPLLMYRSPVDDMEAVTKKYLEDNVPSIHGLFELLEKYYTKTQLDIELAKKLNTSGGTVHGVLKLVQSPVLGNDATNKQYVDELVNALSSTNDSLTSRVSALESKGYVTGVEMDSALAEIRAYIGSNLNR